MKKFVLLLFFFVLLSCFAVSAQESALDEAVTSLETKMSDLSREMICPERPIRGDYYCEEDYDLDLSNYEANRPHDMKFALEMQEIFNSEIVKIRDLAAKQMTEEKVYDTITKLLYAENLALTYESGLPANYESGVRLAEEMESQGNVVSGLEIRIEILRQKLSDFPDEDEIEGDGKDEENREMRTFFDSEVAKLKKMAETFLNDPTRTDDEAMRIVGLFLPEMSFPEFEDFLITDEKRKKPDLSFLAAWAESLEKRGRTALAGRIRAQLLLEELIEASGYSSDDVQPFLSLLEQSETVLQNAGGTFSDDHATLAEIAKSIWYSPKMEPAVKEKIARIQKHIAEMFAASDVGQREFQEKTDQITAFTKLLAEADRIRIFDPSGKTEFLTLTTPSELAEFRSLWEFAPSEDWLHCLCIGFPFMEAFKGEERILQMSFHHGYTLRSSEFRDDAALTKSSRVRAARWMIEHVLPQLEEDSPFAKEWRRVAGPE